MTKIPAMPFFADAYMGDTPHLTLEEHGAYTRLLMIHWLMLPDHIPDDEKRVARMLGTTPGRWRKLKKTICDGKLYSIRDGFFRQKRLEKEFETVSKNIRQKKMAASKRWNAKSLKSNNSSNAAAYPDAYADAGAAAYAADQLPHMPLTLTLIEEEKEKKYIKKKKSSEPEFSERAKPRRRLPESWEPSEKTIAAARNIGYDRAAIKKIVDEFRDYWHAEGKIKADWDRTLLNWLKSDITRKKYLPDKSTGSPSPAIGSAAAREQEDRWYT